MPTAHCQGVKRVLVSAMAIGLASSLAACGGTSTLSGAGASFPSPIYQRWFQELASKGVRVNYQSVGSGAGVRQFLSRTVDFAASDVPDEARGDRQGAAGRGADSDDGRRHRRGLQQQGL